VFPQQKLGRDGKCGEGADMLLLFVCSYSESFPALETETCFGGTDLIE